MNQMLGDFVADFVGAFAEGMAGLISGDIGLSEFFYHMLGMFGGFVVQFGKLLIGYGIAFEAFKKAPGPMKIIAWIALVAIVFYPLALGVGMLDPYAWGYGSIGLLAAVIATALIAWLMGSNRIAIILALAVLAWAAGWHESANLWDYILDPFLGLWAIGSLFQSAWQARAARVQTGYLFRKG
jgi:hypothetical protein